MGWLIALALGVGAVSLFGGAALAAAPSEGRTWRVVRGSSVDWTAIAGRVGQDPGAMLLGQIVILHVASKVAGDPAAPAPVAVEVDRQTGPASFEGRAIGLPDVPIPRTGPKAGTSIAFTLADAYGLAR